MKLLNNKSFKDVFFSTKGRLGVNETWIYGLGLYIIGILINNFFSFLIWKIVGGYNYLGGNYSNTQITLSAIITILERLIYVLLGIMNIFVLIKRAHDLGKKGSRLRYLLIPIYNIIEGFRLCFHPGQKEENKYGKYENDRLPKATPYILIAIEFIIIFGGNILGYKNYLLYLTDNEPIIKLNERIADNEKISNLWFFNDSFYDDAEKEMKNIIDTKLNCDCYGEDATEKPNIQLNKQFRNETCEELKPKLLKLAEDPKYNKEK